MKVTHSTQYYKMWGYCFLTVFFINQWNVDLPHSFRKIDEFGNRTDNRRLWGHELFQIFKQLSEKNIYFSKIFRKCLIDLISSLWKWKTNASIMLFLYGLMNILIVMFFVYELKCLRIDENICFKHQIQINHI